MIDNGLILGVNLLGHDLSLTGVATDGSIAFMAEEERYSGMKRGRFYFNVALAVEILREHGFAPSDVRYLVLVNDPSLWKPEDYKTIPYSPPARKRHQAAWALAFKKVFEQVENISYLRHHFAHAASAFYCSPWDNAAVVTSDGFGDGETATISAGERGVLRTLKSYEYPHSFPYLFRAAATWLGFHGDEREGKLMALSGFGDPSFEKIIREKLGIVKQSRFYLPSRFVDQKCDPLIWANIISTYLGKGRAPTDKITQTHCDYAAGFQRIFEDQIEWLLREARRITGVANCCCAGGAFYNCAANGKLLEMKIYDHVYFQPLAGDTGLSMGAALWKSQLLGRRSATLNTLRLGSKIEPSAVRAMARRRKLRAVKHNDIATWAAQQLSQGSIIGWCQGKSEVGPRALGGRSILADPRNERMIYILNRLKRRESWQPFAPIVLSNYVRAIIGRKIDSPFMNIAFRVSAKQHIPAAVHFDGTTRVQTIDKETDPITFTLLEEFYALTGIGALINTSLNIQGKPIARLEEDCIMAAIELGLDYIVIDDYAFESKHALPVCSCQNKASQHFWPRKRYELIIIDPLENLASTYDWLMERAENIYYYLMESDCTFVPRCKAPVSPKNCFGVVFIPSPLDVCIETMPRALAVAVRISKYYNSIHVVDDLGQKMDLRFLIGDRSAEDMEDLPLSDVELYYIDKIDKRSCKS